jgi:hypothetical protein
LESAGTTFELSGSWWSSGFTLLLVPVEGSTLLRMTPLEFPFFNPFEGVTVCRLCVGSDRLIVTGALNAGRLEFPPPPNPIRPPANAG